MALFLADLIKDKASLTLSSSSVAEYCLITFLTADCVNLNLTDFRLLLLLWFVDPHGPGTGSIFSSNELLLSLLFSYLFLNHGTWLYTFFTLFTRLFCGSEMLLAIFTAVFTAVFKAVRNGENHPVAAGGVSGAAGGVADAECAIIADPVVKPVVDTAYIADICSSLRIL